jgi:MFS family permease
VLQPSGSSAVIDLFQDDLLPGQQFGGLTAVGPIAGGYLIQWTWRAIFWINIPVALIALALIAISKPPNQCRPAPMDYRGLALIIGGVGLSVFGFQQSALWGWANPAIEAAIAVGVVLLARPPGSPRPSATTAPASASPSWAPS